MDDRVEAVQQPVHRRQRVAHDGRRAKQKTVGGEHRVRGRLVVVGDQVEQPHLVHAARVQAGHDLPRQLLGIAVGRDIGDGDRFRGVHRRRAPVFIQVDIIGDVGAQHRTVPVADELNVPPLDLFQRVGHVRIRSDDVVEIILVRVVEIALDQVVEHPLVAVMAAERIAGEQRGPLGNIGVHGIRPVQHRHPEEAERQPAKVQLVALADHHARKRTVDDLGQKLDGRLGADHRGVRRDLQQRGDRADVVGLGMVDDQIVDLRRVADRADALGALVPERVLDRLDQRGLVRAPDQIRVIGRAVLGAHNDIEHAQVRVQRADPPNIVHGFQSMHHSFIPSVMLVKDPCVYYIPLQSGKQRQGK